MEAMKDLKKKKKLNFKKEPIPLEKKLSRRMPAR